MDIMKKHMEPLELKNIVSEIENFTNNNIDDIFLKSKFEDIVMEATQTEAQEEKFTGKTLVICGTMASNLTHM